MRILAGATLARAALVAGLLSTWACNSSTPPQTQSVATQTPTLVPPNIVDGVRAAIDKNDFADADRQVQAYRQAYGETPEIALAVSWLGRGALAAKNLDAADAYAEQARQLAIKTLGTRHLDQDPFLPNALGAAIEVHGKVLQARGETAEAVTYLREALATYNYTSMHERIQKNINLMTLEGQPAPDLEANVWFGPRPPKMSSLRGKAVLLFFWAHWCPDCKAEVPIIARLMRKFGPEKLALIGPTRYYGYTAGGDDATPEVEKPYIDKIRHEFYAPLADMPAPLSNENFAKYGASSTPTLALVDRKGIVRWYHPGAATEQELGSKIEALLR